MEQIRYMRRVDVLVGVTRALALTLTLTLALTLTLTLPLSRWA